MRGNMGNIAVGLSKMGIGNGFGASLANGYYFYGHDAAKLKQRFFETTFVCMGYLAKLDGRVCEEEIEEAQEVMERLELNERQREYAISLFNKGKDQKVDCQKQIKKLKDECERRSLLRAFIDIQLRMAYCDGELTSAEKEYMMQLRLNLDFSRLEFQHMEESIRNIYLATGVMKLHEAYAVLQVEHTINESELKKVYRRLMSQLHPDKLMAQKASQSILDEAMEKTRIVKAAFDQIRRARDF